MPASDNMPKAKVLFVDDEAKILNNIKVVLADEFELFTSVNIQSAEKILEENTDIKVVVADQKMGDNVLGTDFLAKIADKYPDMIRIILSGYSEFDVAHRSIKDGKVFDFVVKEGDYIESVRRSVYKALEWYVSQKEMRRLRAIVRQFDHVELVEIKGELRNPDRKMVHIVDADRDEREIAYVYYKTLHGYCDKLFGNPANEKIKGLKLYNGIYDYVFIGADLKKKIGNYFRPDEIQPIFMGKYFSGDTLRNELFHKIKDETVLINLIEQVIEHDQKLAQLVVYGSRKYLTIQEGPKGIYYSIYNRAEGEKVVVQERMVEGCKVVNLKKENDSIIGYEITGTRLGTPELLLDKLLEEIKK